MKRKIFSLILSLTFIFNLFIFLPTAEAAVNTPVTKRVNVAKGKKVITNGVSHGSGDNLVNDIIDPQKADYWICFAGAASANPDVGALASQAEAIIDLGRKYKPEEIVVFDRQGTIATDRDFFVILGSNDPTFSTSVKLFEMGVDASSFPQNKELTIIPEDDGYYRYIKY